jgi:hypothetical protein
MVLPEGAPPDYDTLLHHIDLSKSLPRRIGTLFPRPSRQAERPSNSNCNQPRPGESSSRPTVVD